jgi:probable rRNA maturation factor
VERVRNALQRAASATLQEEEVPAPASLTLLLTSAERMQALNLAYRQLDEPTDVLSFPAEQGLPGMDAYLGDVAIAVPVAQAQAEAGGHGLLAELSLLTVHGTLHLLGYDHLEPDEKQAMWTVQDQILAQLGLALRSPTYDD